VKETLKVTTLVMSIAILSACNSADDVNPQLPDFLGGGALDLETGDPVQDNLATRETNSQLYTGLFDWDLSDFETEATGVDRDVFTNQRIVHAESDEMFCVARLQHFNSDIGLDLAFTQFSSGSDGGFIRLDDFDAPNGPAKQYLSLHVQDNDLAINTIGHFYYFSADQVSYRLDTMFNLYCYTLAETYAAHEAAMRSQMETIEFREAKILTNVVAEDWSGFRSSDNVAPSRLRFRNRSDEELEIFWITQEGERQSMGKISPDTGLSVDTGVGHIFIVVNSSGTVIGQYRAIGTDSLAIIL